MTYESWRATFQSSEQAARSAYQQVSELAARVAELEEQIPDGFCIAPVTRGYARMGAGRYVLQECTTEVDGATVPSLVIRLATEEECQRRTVGSLEETPEDQVGVPIDPDIIVCQLDFVSDAGLRGLEQQLRLLRHAAFPGVVSHPESPVRLTDDEIYNVAWDVSFQDIQTIPEYKIALSRAIESAVLRANGYAVE